MLRRVCLNVVVHIIIYNPTTVKVLTNIKSHKIQGMEMVKLTNKTKRAYLYNPKDKTESFGVITIENNYGKSESKINATIQSMLPKHVETVNLFTVNNLLPFGERLADLISTEPDDIIEGIKGLPPQGEEKETPAVTKNRFLLIKEFVEMCIDYPQMFTLGQFQRLLVFTKMSKQFPKSLGFFTVIKDVPPSQYLMYYGHDLQISPIDNLNTLDLPHIENAIRPTLPYERSGGYVSESCMEVFEVSGVIDEIMLSLFHLIQEKTLIKKCGNCGKYFVPLLRSDAIYCDRPAPQNSKKTCKVYGAKTLWYENMISDEVAKLAKNVYYAKQMLAKRNPDKPEYAAMYEYFKSEKKKWEAAVRAGKKTREEYVAWLNQMKLQKTLQ